MSDYIGKGGWIEGIGAVCPCLDCGTIIQSARVRCGHCAAVYDQTAAGMIEAYALRNEMADIIGVPLDLDNDAETTKTGEEP